MFDHFESFGTIASGDRLKRLYPETKIIGLEPIQCRTLYSNGFGDNDIQGIGDKHVTWIHNVMNMDAMICVDDMESKKGLQLLTSNIGKDYLVDVVGISKENVSTLSQILGISGVCNLIGATKTAKYYEMTEDDNIFIICTDTIDRYYSVMDNLDKEFGTMDKTEATVRYNCIFKNIKPDYIQEGTYATKKNGII